MIIKYLGMIFCVALISCGCKKNMSDKTPKTLPKKSDIGRIAVFASNQHIINEEWSRWLQVCVSINKSNTAEYYLAFENVSDTLIKITFVCQRKYCGIKKIPSFLVITIGSIKYNVITGLEDLIERDNNSDSQSRYFSGDEILYDTSTFVYGNIFFNRRNGKYEEMGYSVRNGAPPFHSSNYGLSATIKERKNCLKAHHYPQSKLGK